MAAIFQIPLAGPSCICHDLAMEAQINIEIELVSSINQSGRFALLFLTRL